MHILVSALNPASSGRDANILLLKLDVDHVVRNKYANPASAKVFVCKNCLICLSKVGGLHGLLASVDDGVVVNACAEVYFIEAYIGTSKLADCYIGKREQSALGDGSDSCKAKVAGATSYEGPSRLGVSLFNKVGNGSSVGIF